MNILLVLFSRNDFNIIFRNFKRPMAVQDKKNEQHYINNYNVRMLFIKFVFK